MKPAKEEDTKTKGHNESRPHHMAGTVDVVFVRAGKSVQWVY